MIRTKENAHLFKYQTNKEVRRVIDKCLHGINANIAQHAGRDSTDKDKKHLESLNKPLREKIKETDEAYYYELYPPHID